MYVNCKCRFQFYICFWKNLFPPLKLPSSPSFAGCSLALHTVVERHCGHSSFIVCTKTFLCEHDLATWLTVAMLSGSYWTRVGEKLAKLRKWRQHCGSYGLLYLLVLLQYHVSCLWQPCSGYLVHHQQSETCPCWWCIMLHTDPVWFCKQGGTEWHGTSVP
jgi:hypothetical protein